MRIWDCSPEELARCHLLGEWNEIHQLWRAVWRRRLADAVNPKTGRQFGWLHHPETTRFVARPELLVARFDFLANEGHARGYSLVAPLEVVLTDGSTITDDDIRSHNTMEADDWFSWCIAVNWPLLDPLVGATSPWKREDITYKDYRLTSQYADGVFEETFVPPRGTFGYWSDRPNPALCAAILSAPLERLDDPAFLATLNENNYPPLRKGTDEYEAFESGELTMASFYEMPQSMRDATNALLEEDQED